MRAFNSVQSIVSDSLWPHGLQHTRPPCPSPSPRACSNSCPLTRVMPSNHRILCHPLLLLPSIFPSIRAFSNESALCIMRPKYWSFSISPSNEYWGLISFRMDWFDLLSVQRHNWCFWITVLGGSGEAATNYTLGARPPGIQGSCLKCPNL